MKKLTAIITLSVLTTMPLFAGAVNIPRNTVPQGITSFQGFLNLFDKVISWLFTILMVFAVLMIVYAAFSYLTSGGDEEKVGSAHKRIMYAIVAIAVAFLAQGISFVVAELLGQPVQ
jgi:heme/copper-type cytochrome/quinol oxidase subunit 2